ncbi:MAG: hypothetical protein OQK35_01905 [Alphaproteobacteria bacterium]|nr:hypothetical protein [Rhodospirillales bacterium]MCW9045063.1 hypothetical protein [Alphaproteobacteria bacterium]
MSANKGAQAPGNTERVLTALPLEDDRDSLSVLPLHIIPLETKQLRTARMIKNVRLESAIELFRNDEGTGSGQYYIHELGPVLGWPQEGDVPDRGILMKLALLHSYDVFSLRISLREYGIAVNELDGLKLSAEKNETLTGYMGKFTRPLLTQIFGNDVEFQDFSDILALFKNPDKSRALASLQQMADKLEIEIMQVPAFLEDYGDIFLSLSYYRQCLDSMGPIMESFLDSLEDIRKNWQLKNDRNTMKTCDMVEDTMNNLTAEITGRFENFDRSTNEMWDNLSAEKFRRVEALIKNYHTTIGGVLCALWVKMDAFQKLFPKADSGGPVKRSEFIMSEMKQGLENIQKIEGSAPMLAGIDD